MFESSLQHNHTPHLNIKTIKSFNLALKVFWANNGEVVVSDGSSRTDETVENPSKFRILKHSTKLFKSSQR